MKKFRFSLQSVLDFRKHLEKMAQMDVAKARKNLMDSEQRLKELNQDYDDTSFEFDGEMSKGISSERFHFFTDYLSSVTSQIEREEQRKITLSDILREKQHVLRDKTIERKTIEQLKEKHKNEYYDNMMKDMQKEVDDMVIIRQKRELADGDSAI